MPAHRVCGFVFANLCVVLLLAAGLDAGGTAGAADARHEDRARYTSEVSGVPPLRGIMSPERDMYEKDLEDLAEWGVKLVRFQLTRNWEKLGTDRDTDDYDKWLDGRLANLEKMLPVARRLGIRFVVDLHTPPGGRFGQNYMNMFEDTAEDRPYAEYFVAIWERIATRFLNHEHKEAIWAYDLMNEPVLSPQARARDAAYNLFLRAARAIRKIDPDVALSVECLVGPVAVVFAEFKPFPPEIENVIYQAHFYSPFTYTYQYLLPETTPAGNGPPEYVEYPGIIDHEFWYKERVREELEPIREFQLKYGARMYIGEFSAVCWAPNADVFLRDCVEIFDEYGWDWSYHAFRDYPGWSLEHGGEPPYTFWPDKNNLRMKAMRDAWASGQK